MINMTTTLVRANFIDLEKMQCTIAVFNNYEDIANNKKAVFYRTVHALTAEIISTHYDCDNVDFDTSTTLSNCFNKYYVAQDSISEYHILKHNKLDLDEHEQFKTCVFYCDFEADDLDEQRHSLVQ